MFNRATISRIVWYIMISVVFIGLAMSQERARDKEMWSRIAPSGSQPVNARKAAQSEYVPQAMTPRVIRTVDGSVTITPPTNIRMHPQPGGSQSEMHIAVHPTNQNMVIAGSNAANIAVTALSQGWYITTNGGTGWYGSDTLPPHIPTMSTHYTSDPMVGIDRNGNLYFNTLHYSSSSGDVVVTKSTDNGTTWSNFVALPDPNPDEDKNWFAVDVNASSPYAGYLYCAYTDFNSSGGAYRHVRFGRSTDGGASWIPSPPVNISGTTNYLDQGVNLTVGPNGEVYAIWTGYASSSLTTSRVGFNKSTDGGATWGTPSFASGTINDIRGTLTKGGNSIRVNSFPYIAVDRSGGSRNGWIYTTFPAENSAGKINVYMTRSSDGGTTWTDTIKVNQDNTGRDHWFSACAVDPATGHLYVIYYDSRNFAANDSAQMYMSRSIDGGTTFEDILVSDQAFLPDAIDGLAGGYSGDYIAIAALNGTVWPCWNDNRTGTHQAYTAKMQFAYNYGFAKGIINSSLGGPLQGVQVDFEGTSQQQTGTSDADGYYFAGAPVDTNVGTQQYTLRAQKFGYLTYSDTITLILHDSVARNITLSPAPGGTLAVYAHNNGSAPIRANVRVKFGSTEVINEYTDSLTGMFSSPLPVGMYDVTVDPPSPYGTLTYANVQIQQDSTNTIDALVRYVVEATPAALFDTLGVGQSNTVMLTLTNTTGGEVPYRVSNDETAFNNLTNLPQYDPASPSNDAYLAVGKDEQDPRFGPAQTFGKGGPDAFGYVWIDSDEPGGPTFGWVDISTVGTQITDWGSGSGDEGHNIQSLPFSFPFYGNTYSSIKIATNGFISFDVVSTNHTYTNTSIPSAGEPNLNVFGFWDDLDVRTSGGIYYYHDAANGRFIIEYLNAPHYGTTEPGTYTFEIILYANGTIVTQYLDMQQTLNSGSIGIENSTGADGLQVVFNNTYVHNDLAILFKLRGVDWLSHDPAFGTIPANSSVDITNTFDADGLIPGTTYLADIFVDATHPDVSGSVTVPASLRVEPLNGPGINVSPLSKNFGNVIIYESKTDSVKIRNIGTQQLDISEVTSTNADFTYQLTSNAIQPGDSAKLYITYTPQLPAGAETGTVYVLSNDPLNDTVAVSVSGTAVGAPHFTSATTLLDKTLEGGVMDSIQFMVGNDGTLDGDYQARAVMYSTVEANRAANPVVLPVTVTKKSKNNQRQMFAENSPSKDMSLNLGKDEPDPRFGPEQTFGAGGPDSAGYTWIDSDEPGGPSFNWIDISSVGTAITTWESGTGDDGHVTRSLPFSFPFRGVDYTQLKITTNGWVSFDVVSTNHTYSNTAIPNSAQPNNSLFGFWDDLDVRTSGTIYHYYDAANAQYIVQYNNVPHLSSGGPYTFEIILKQSGEILYQYLTMTSRITEASIGFENVTGTDGLQVVYNNTYVHDNLAIRIAPPGGGGGGGPWLGIHPTSGSIIMGDSTQLTATFDATSPGIYNNPGDYYGRIEITATNSTLAESLNIPAHMFVIPPAGPRMSVTPDSLGFGNVEIGQYSELTVLVKNIGAGALDVTGINITNANFSATPTTFILNSLDTQQVTVRFTAPTPGGTQYGTLTFSSNDASAPDVQLGARSVGVPHISATPDSFYVAHPSGPDTLTQNLTIENTGTDTLQFAIEEIGTTGLVAEATPPDNEPAYDLPKDAIDPRSGAAQLLGSGGPDAFGYRWIDSDEPGGPTFNWVDISTVGTLITDWGSGTGDEGHNIQSLPFNFPFYGNSYSSVKIATNGFISFDVVSTNHTYTNTTIPATGEPNLNIFAFWDDLDVRTAGGIYYYNDVANNRFIVEYKNAPHYGTTSPGIYTFEIIIYSNGTIVTQYYDMQQTLNSASIGIENATGTVGLQVVYNNTYVHNNLAILFTADLYPWLSTNVTSGKLGPGESQIVQVRTHPGIDLPAGTYNGKIRVTGNTADVENVAVRMDVTGGTPYIQVTAPNGGETYIVGQSYNITWTKNLVDSVKLEYSTDGGASWFLINAGVPALRSVDVTPPKGKMNVTEMMGSYLWTIPNAPTTQGRVRVSDKNNASITDMSNANFTISSTPPATWATQTSGTTSALYAVSIVNSQVAWVGGDAGVVRYTTNGGTNWTAAAIPLSGQPIHNVFALNDSVAFVCVNPSAGNDGRIYRTTNRGIGWSLVYQNTGAGAFMNAVSMFDGMNGMAMGDPVNGQWTLLRTSNGGSSWYASGTLPQNGTEAGWNNSLEWRGSLGWFGTSNSRVYYTTDAGTNWLYSATPAANSYGVSFITDQLGMLGAATGATAASTNGGASWAASASAGTGGALFPAGVAVPTQRWWMTSGSSVYKTTNQGTNWAVDHSRSGAFNHVAMKVVPEASVIVGYAVGASGQISKYVEYLPITVAGISGMKFEDLDADGVKDNGEPGLQGWKIYLSGDAVDSTVTDASGAYSFPDLSEGDYIVSEGLQEGWYQSAPATGTYEISLTAGQSVMNQNFGNYRLGSIAGMKYEDSDGDSSNTDDNGIGGWMLMVSGAQSDTAMTDTTGAFSFTGLKPGTYTLTEEHRGGWTVTEPASGSYQVNLQSGQNLTGYLFGNFELGSISGVVWKDINGNGVQDDGEPGSANWVVNAVGENPGNTHQATTDANGNYSISGLFADAYDVSEVLQAGYSITFPPGGSYSSFTFLSGDHLTAVDFGNFTADTGYFRTFMADSIALARDVKGKIGKPIVKKANRVTFKFNLTVPNAALHFLQLDFNMAVNATIYRGTGKTNVIGTMNGKRFGPVNLPVTNGEIIQVDGYGTSGKLVRVLYQWNALPKTNLPDNQFLVNKIGIPMPNAVNLVTELYQQGKFGSAGMNVGLPLSGTLSLRYGWAQITKLSDALKSFYDGGARHTGTPRAFDLYGTKAFVGKRSVVSAKKHNNKLFAELAALKINIVSSASGKTPIGFGDLLFDDGSGNQFCGRTVIEIASAVDSFVTFRLLSPDSVAMEYYTTVRMLNASFSGLIDTVSFASKLVLKGTRRLYEVPYLHLNPTGERTVIAESDLFIPQVPEQFSLEQNYPNPFNPSTMITFMMPEDGIVTLKVFDLLGREVASLVNREEMSAGEYDVEFVANNLVSGVYFYRITIETPNEEYDEENGIGGVNTFTQVRKLLLMK